MGWLSLPCRDTPLSRKHYPLPNLISLVLFTQKGRRNEARAGWNERENDAERRTNPKTNSRYHRYSSSYWASSNELHLSRPEDHICALSVCKMGADFRLEAACFARLQSGHTAVKERGAKEKANSDHIHLLKVFYRWTDEGKFCHSFVACLIISSLTPL